MPLSHSYSRVNFSSYILLGEGYREMFYFALVNLSAEAFFYWGEEEGEIGRDENER